MLIYDVGMHNGDDTAYYLAKGARVVAIDANPALCEVASQRFAAEIAEGRLTILNIAVGDGDGDAFFYRQSERGVGNSLVPIRGAERITVRLRRLSGVFAEHGMPDFAKIDVEHVDHVVMAELRCSGRLPAALSVEAHREEVIDELTSAGYKAFRVVNGSRVRRRFANHTIRNISGERLPWSFPDHSSGPFGDDLPGAWTDSAGLHEIWPSREKLLGRGWYDVHASFEAPQQAQDGYGLPRAATASAALASGSSADTVALPSRDASHSMSALTFAAPVFAHIAGVGLRAILSVATLPASARRIDFELRGPEDGEAFLRLDSHDITPGDPAGAPVEVVHDIIEDSLPSGPNLLRAILRNADGEPLAEATTIVVGLMPATLPLHPAMTTALRSTTLAVLPLVPLGADSAKHPGNFRIEMRKPSEVPLARLAEADFHQMRAAGGPAKRFAALSYPLNGLYVASLEAASAFGQSGTVSTRDGVVGESWMHYHPRIPSAYQLRAFLKRPSAVEECGDIGIWWGAPWRSHDQNYYHTHGEWLCALMQLEMFRDLSGVPEFEILMPAPGGWPGQLVELLGVDRVRHIGDRTLMPRRLYWPSALLKHNLGIEPLLRQVFRRIRLGAETRRAAGAVRAPERLDGAEMVYISRVDSHIRPMRNEAELIAALEARGVRVFTARGLSVAEQVLGMSNARVVIGPHGAGLTNIGYARPDALVVEIHPGFYVTPLFFRMSQVLGQRYRCFTQQHTPIPGDDPKAWTIDVAAFLEFLDQALDRDSAAQARSSDNRVIDGAA